MNLPTPAFLALAATLTVQVGALAWIFSDRPRKRLLIRFLKFAALFDKSVTHKPSGGK